MNYIEEKTKRSELTDRGSKGDPNLIWSTEFVGKFPALFRLIHKTNKPTRRVINQTVIF